MNNSWKVWVFAAAILIVLLVVSVFAGFIAWIWAKIAIGFGIAAVIWVIQNLRKKPMGNGFLVWWSIGITAILVGLDLLTIYLVRLGWFIAVVLTIGFFIWLWLNLRKKE